MNKDKDELYDEILSDIEHVVVDIEGNELNVGDEVYYARKASYRARGELVKGKITKINIVDQVVQIGKFKATQPTMQIIKIHEKVSK